MSVNLGLTKSHDNASCTCWWDHFLPVYLPLLARVPRVNRRNRAHWWRLQLQAVGVRHPVPSSLWRLSMCNSNCVATCAYARRRVPGCRPDGEATSMGSCCRTAARLAHPWSSLPPCSASAPAASGPFKQALQELPWALPCCVRAVGREDILCRFHGVDLGCHELAASTCMRRLCACRQWPGVGLGSEPRWIPRCVGLQHSVSKATAHPND